MLAAGISGVTVHCKIIGIDFELLFFFFGPKMQRNLHLENTCLGETENVISH